MKQNQQCLTVIRSIKFQIKSLCLFETFFIVVHLTIIPMLCTYHITHLRKGGMP